MNFAQLILAGGLTFTAVLGIVIYLTNSRRGANQQFFILSLTVTSWLLSVLAVFRSTDPGIAVFWMRSAALTGGFLPVAFTLLRLSISNPEKRLLALLVQASGWLAVYAAIAIFCLTPLYLTGAKLQATGVPDATPGALSLLFSIYFMAALLMVVWGYWKEIKLAVGIQLFELQFAFLGVVAFLGAGLFAGVIPLIARNSQIVSLSPLWVVLMNSLIAYGIATKRIMGVGVMARRFVSYGLLTGYLVTLYGLTWWCSKQALHYWLIKSAHLPALCGAFVVVATMSRVQNSLQIFVSRIFVNFHEVNLSDSLTMADSVLTAVTTTDDLIHRFSEFLVLATGADSVAIHLFQDPVTTVTAPMAGAPDLRRTNGELITILNGSKKPFLESAINRQRSAAVEHTAAGQLRELKGALVVGIHGHDMLEGVVVLGAKLSGRTYDEGEQKSLQILVNRMAVALENAKLYTEIERGKKYVESLLDQLVSGVIAADEAGHVVVCNREARRILQTEEESVVGALIGSLPHPFADTLRAILSSRIGLRDQRAVLKVSSGQDVPVRFGGDLFHDGKVSGVLIVFEDLTEIKRLEGQLRRSDRLASLGTLSASVAHEIRNPLVPIRTFVELIPERIDDPVFLNKFAEIVGGEVKRIDRFVTQLLSFSKTSVPQRSQIDLQEVLDRTVALLHHELVKRKICLAKNYAPELASICADPHQLEQVFLNIILNACDAMPDGGVLKISTRSVSPIQQIQEIQETHKGSIEVRFEDDGPGISPEKIAKIFDPFFTTKESGTGLGLSIAYGIITDHGGTIEIGSNADHGAIVILELPVEQMTKSLL